jgi:hypothetical protein
MLRKALFLMSGLLTMGAEAQILSVSPLFPKEQDTVTIIYDATQGNAALAGVTQVYAHTGVITTRSASNADWRYVIGNWGTADARVQMQNLGNNKHRLRFHMKNFYAQAGTFQPGELILSMAFVFRDQNGNTVGRTAEGKDIYSPVFSTGLFARIVNPETKVNLRSLGSSFLVEAWASKDCGISLSLDGVQVRSKSSADSLQYLVKAAGAGRHTLIFSAADGSLSTADTQYFVVNPTVKNGILDASYQQGVNYLASDKVRLVLFAPNKSFIYAIGDFSNWEPDTAYFMQYSPAQSLWWVDITNLTPGREVGFQYWVDGKIRVADPFSELVLNEYDDAFISTQTYPGLKPYPKGKTNGAVGVMTPGKAAYTWTTQGYQRPKKERLIIYELLLRDFSAAHTFKFVQDSLTYLKKLGINTIKLMPVNEFEGNISWGYNPSFHMAVDKYYGRIDDLKALIDAAHKQGIAVILDVVFNHAFSQSPLCQLYWNSAAFKPANNNPWVNPDARHPFNVGYDMNHESRATQYWMDRILRYWTQEFKVDGFRFDLSKGFTQVNSGSDVAAWGRYDASRIALLKRMADQIRSVDPNIHLILEHFADNSEEKELNDYGFMTWGNGNAPFSEATMGFIGSSDFGWSISREHRGFNQNGIVGYMESHDEERLMYKNKKFGNSSGTYLVQNLPVGLSRVAMASCLFLPVPGPKMIWQFGELGYDYSINHCSNGTESPNCRLDVKPVRWDYWNDTNRRKLYYVMAAMNYLKTLDEVAFPVDYDLNAAGQYKRLNLWHPNLNVVVVSNFGMAAGSADPNFPFTGRWYDYLSGDSMDVNNKNGSISLPAGGYKVYTSRRVAHPYYWKSLNSSTATVDVPGMAIRSYPNPAKELLHIEAGNESFKASIFDLSGKKLMQEYGASGKLTLVLHGLKPGMYLLEISSDGGVHSSRLLVE